MDGEGLQACPLIQADRPKQLQCSDLAYTASV
jgi:hypothetical protein